MQREYVLCYIAFCLPFAILEFGIPMALLHILNHNCRRVWLCPATLRLHAAQDPVLNIYMWIMLEPLAKLGA